MTRDACSKETRYRPVTMGFSRIFELNRKFAKLNPMTTPHITDCASIASAHSYLIHLQQLSHINTKTKYKTHEAELGGGGGGQ